MNDALRSRIAAVVNDALPWDGPHLALSVADAVIRELLAGYVLVPKNVTLFEWADPVFMGQEEGQFKHERITEWEPTDD